MLSCAPPQHRALILSAFTAQMLCLRICGQLLYLPWDSALRLASLERMLRFRITLSVCSLFCWFGVAALLLAGSHLRQRSLAPLVMADEPTSRAPEALIRTPSEQQSATHKTAQTAPDGCTRSTALHIALCLVVLLLVACYDTLLITVWPLFLNTHFGWREEHFAPLLFASTSASACAVALYPRLHAALGGSLAALGLASTLALSAMLAFTLQSPALAPYNVGLIMISNSCIAALIPAVNALASTHIHDEYVGRLFAGMNITVSLGRSIAGILGTRLYEFSVSQPQSDSVRLVTLGALGRGGALPTSFLAPLMVAAAVCLHVANASANHTSTRILY